MGGGVGTGLDRQLETTFLWVLSAVLRQSGVGEERFDHNLKFIKILRSNLLRNLARYK